jgi:alpha-N-arabinofuranosidase
LDVLAVLDEEGRHLIVTLVNRSADSDPIEVEVVTGGLAVGPEAELVSLSGETMYDQNTLDEPTRIAPRTRRVPVVAGQVQLVLPPYALARLTFGL